MRIIKRVLYAVASFLELVFVAGAYIFNYFTVKKLGFVRWVNYYSLKWERANPVETIKLAAIIAVAISLVLIILLFIRNRKNCNRIVYAMVAVLTALAILAEGQIIFRDFKHMRAYYFLSLFFLAAYGLQLIKTAVAIFVCRHEK